MIYIERQSGREDMMDIRLLSKENSLPFGDDKEQVYVLLEVNSWEIWRRRVEDFERWSNLLTPEEVK